MKYNIKATLVLLLIVVSTLCGKTFATNYSYGTANGTFGVLTTSYVYSMSNTYLINTSSSSTIVLMYTADLDPNDYLVINTVDANNTIIASKVVTDGSGTYTTTLANGRAYVTFISGISGQYSDMGYRGFTIQYSTTSSLAQAQVFSYNGSTVLTGKVGIGTYTPGYALDVSGSTNVSNDLFASGKIGIGTQTPATSLNIVGTTDLSPTTHGLFVIGATNTTNLGFDQNEIMARTYGVASTLYINNDGGNVVFNGTNTAGGNVGIGISIPTSKLHISNTTSLSGIGGANINVIQTQPTSTAGDGGLSVVYSLTAASSTNELVFKGADIRSNNYLTAGGVVQYQRVLNLSSGSSVGSTTTNLEMIRVEPGGTSGTTTNAYGLNIVSLPGTNRWGIYDQSGSNWYSSGKVGIGTNIPSNLLDVRGINSVTTGGHDITAFANVAGTAGVVNGWYANGTAVTGGWTRSINSMPYFLGTTSAPQALTIFNNGNVGIGTTNPDPNALLTVNGTIHAKEVKIDLAGFLPDYVFEKNYALRSLNEVHSFIKDNGHLPEIPSAAEVKKDGINVSDMQVKLLKKIEELTLYAIEQQEISIDQQKRIEALEKELRQVKNK